MSNLSQDDTFVNGNSPFIRAEQVKREYASRLDELFAEATIELSIALDFDPLSQPSAYQLSELAGYISRLGRVLRRHQNEADERAAKAELAERGSAWVQASLLTKG